MKDFLVSLYIVGLLIFMFGCQSKPNPNEVTDGQYTLIAIRDEKNKVTCYRYYGDGISCLRDEK